MVFVAQWIARWTSNPEAAGSNPVEDGYLFYYLNTFRHLGNICTESQLITSDNDIESRDVLQETVCI